MRSTTETENILSNLKIGMQPGNRSIFQLFFIVGHGLTNPAPMVIVYSNSGAADLSHFPKEDIINLVDAK